MSIIDEMREWMRDRKLRRMLAEEDASARKLQEVVEAIIDRARRSEEAGVRKDKVLFAFESDFEQISDRIARLRESGDKETYRDLYARLYAFAEERMADSYDRAAGSWISQPFLISRDYGAGFARGRDGNVYY